MGRFLNPDQTLVDQYPEDPQSWNLYSYVRNSPLRFSDPSGRKCIKTDDGQEAEDDTLKLGAAVFASKNAGLEIPAAFLAHISPLGWEHINLTAEYRWPAADSPPGPRPLA